MALKKANANIANEAELTQVDINAIHDKLALYSKTILFTKLESVSVVQSINTANAFFLENPAGTFFKILNYDGSSSVPVSIELHKLKTSSANVPKLVPGNFGTGGQAITANHLEFIIKRKVNEYDLLETAPVILDYGDIGATTVIAHINALDPGVEIVATATNLTIIKAIVNGSPESYIYVGDLETYGLNDAEITANELEVLEVNNDLVEDNNINESDLEDLQAESEEQEVIIGGVYDNFQVEGNIIVCTNTDGKAVFTGFNISEDYKIIYLINNSNFEIQIDNENSSSLEENQISLPNNTASVGLQGTTKFAYVTKGGLNKWQIIDVFGSRYMPEHKGLTEDAAVVVGEDSVSRSKQIVNLYESDPSITSATLTDAELNIRVPGRVIGFELICENAGDNGIVYKLVNDTTGVWKKFILT
jgi:hypothetical protein